MYQIPTFEEYINERLFKSSIDRIKSGEKRAEDKTEFEDYINEIEWVDMGHPEYLFAKYDYYNPLSINDIINTKYPDNISICPKEVFRFLIKDTNRNKVQLKDSPYNYKNFSYVFSYNSSITNQYIYFNIDFATEYITDINVEELLSDSIIKFYIFNLISNHLESFSKFDSKNDQDYIVKLVKKK